MTVHAVYRIEQLAELWQVEVETIARWIEAERSVGRGPTLKQYVVKLARGIFGPKTRWIRGDYASFIQDQYIFRVGRRRFNRAGQAPRWHTTATHPFLRRQGKAK